MGKMRFILWLEKKLGNLLAYCTRRWKTLLGWFICLSALDNVGEYWGGVGSGVRMGWHELVLGRGLKEEERR